MAIVLAMTSAPKNRTGITGRPIDYTPELGLELCKRIARGRSLLAITRDDEDMPERWTIYDWLEADAGGGDFRVQYARAREMLSDFWVEETVEISDHPLEAVKRTIKSGPRMKVRREGDDGDGEFEDAEVNKESVEEVVGDAVERAKLMVSTRQWIGERMNSPKWGKSQQIRHAGADGGALEAPPGAVYFIGVKPGEVDPDADADGEGDPDA